MSLSLMARMLRALGQSFGTEAADTEIESHGLLLSRISAGFTKAADRLDEESRSEAMAFAKAHECTVDHAKMTTQICPCCGVRRGK
jgi:hypothetical protein